MTAVQTLQTFLYSPNAQYLFKRSYSLAVGAPKQTSAFQYGTNVDPATQQASPLRVKFEIDRNMYGTSPNHSKVEIYNLSTQSRQNIKKNYLVNLQAGYNNILGTIFTGNVFLAKSERNASDIITSLECLDGASSIVFSRLDRSYPSGVTLAQILTDVATAMSVSTSYQPVGIGSGIAVNIPSVSYNKGFVAQGPCKDTLDKLLKPQGLEWNIQDNNLNIIPKTKYDGNNAQVVSVDTGMIGIPSQNEFFTQFTSLLNPKLLPGSFVQLVSDNKPLNGYYKIRRSKFEGDSHDNKWQVTCEAMGPFPGIVQTTKAVLGFNYGTVLT